MEALLKLTSNEGDDLFLPVILQEKPARTEFIVVNHFSYEVSQVTHLGMKSNSEKSPMTVISVSDANYQIADSEKNSEFYFKEGWVKEK